MGIFDSNTGYGQKMAKQGSAFGKVKAPAKKPAAKGMSFFGKYPRPMGEITRMNGQAVSGRTWDSANNRWNNDMYMDQTDQNTLSAARQGFGAMLPKLQSAMWTTPEEQGKFISELYDPQARRVNDEFTKALGQAGHGANASGVMNSIGFEDYRTNQLEKNKNQGLQDLYSQAFLQSYQLPGMKMAPILDALQAYDSTQDSILDRQFRMLQPSFDGSTAATNWATNSYVAQQNAKAAKDAGKKGGGGFFSSLL